MDKPIEKILELKTDNLLPGTYTVSVGDKKVTFTWPITENTQNSSSHVQ
jgi:hypothetical protein